MFTRDERRVKSFTAPQEEESKDEGQEDKEEESFAPVIKTLHAKASKEQRTENIHPLSVENTHPSMNKPGAATISSAKPANLTSRDQEPSQLATRWRS